jgi:hypothetical protein
MYGMGAEALTKYAWKKYGLVIGVDAAKRWLWQWSEKYAGYIGWRRWHFEECEASGRVLIGRNAAMGEGRPHYWSWDRYDRGEPGDEAAQTCRERRGTSERLRQSTNSGLETVG